MTRELVFIHGRAQEHKDSVALKQEWLDAFAAGLARAGLGMPLDDSEVRFPYYGQTLYDLSKDPESQHAADVIIRGTDEDSAQKAFLLEVFEEIREAKEIDKEHLKEVADAVVIERGPLNWEWMQGVLRAIDRFVPGGSGAGIALVTNDVYQYMKNPAIHKIINDGVRGAIGIDREAVVVSHSLGTVVAFNLLTKDALAARWSLPMFVTLGSPLGIKAIRKHIRPIAHPRCAASWFNAMDERDVVALYPLDHRRFGVDPAIENKTDVHNHTPNRHGIEGYLGDPVVAARIYQALTA